LRPAVSGPPPAHLDVHWLAALANPTGVAAPWLALAQGLLLSGKTKDGFTAATRAVTAATEKERAVAIKQLSAAWRAANITTPLDGDQAYSAGLSPMAVIVSATGLAAKAGTAGVTLA